MYSVDLQWKTFNVDIPSIESWVRLKFPSAGFFGSSADSDFSLWFSNDPNALPMHDVPSTIIVSPAVDAVPAVAASLVVDLATTVTLSANVAGIAGNVSLTADGTMTLADIVSAWNSANPSNQISCAGDSAQIPPAGDLALSGGAEAVASVSAVTQTAMVSEPSGAPSIAQQIQAHWDSIDSTSAEAVAYATNAAAAHYQAAAAAAISFGQKMMAQFAGQNLQLGITAAGKTKTVRQAMQEVTNCLLTGSLIEAISEIKALPQASYDSTFITAARLLAACNQLETFCGLPLSTSLS
jgi:hypothetical protein